MQGPIEVALSVRHYLKMSQQVFASVCNIKLPTLQKWERGYSKPTPPVNRLFQLVEKGGLGLSNGNAFKGFCFLSDIFLL